MNMKISKAAGIFLCWLVAGCAALSPEPGKKETEVADDLAIQASLSVNEIDRSFFKEVDNIRVTGKTFRISDQPDLPPVFNKSFIIDPQGSTSYDSIAGLISRVSGVHVEVTSDARDSFVELPSKAPILSGDTRPFWIEFSKQGTLEEILDAFAAAGQLSWRYVGGKVQLHKVDTKTFTIDTLSGSETFTSSMGTSVNQRTEGSNTSSSTESEVTAEIPEIWESIVKSVQTMLSNKGKMATNIQSATLTVTDTPDTLRAIQNYVDSENERLRTTIMYRVDIVEVSKRTGDEYGVSMTDLLYQGGNGAFSLTSGASTISDAASALVGTVIRPSSRWNGSQAVIRAISSEMDVVSHRTAFTSEVIGLIARVQEIREQGYLAERSVTSINQTSGIEITQRVETTTEGFTVSMLGTLASSGGLILQTLVDLSNVEEIQRRGTDDNFVESPLRLVRNGKSRSLMQPGDTVIASLIEHNYRESRNKGIGHAWNWLLGGEKIKSNQQNYTVVMVTPYYREY